MKVAIIGAGIVGASIARVLSRYENIEVHLIEKEPDVGWGVSKANTALIHPGHEDDPAHHPLRARFCVRGNKLWHKWVQELDIPSKWPGELMIAFEEKDIKTLYYYLELAQKNNVPNVKILWKEEIFDIEPLVSDKALCALWAPSTGQIAPWEAVIALVENAVENGVKLHTETKVKQIVVEDSRVKGVITENKEFIQADIVINAAGLHADDISKLAGINIDIHPRRGEYYIFDSDSQPKVKRVVHHVPTETTKGVYITTTVEGNPMIGPTSVDLPPDHKDNPDTTKEGLNYIWEHAQKLVKQLPPKSSVIKTFAGLRPEPPDGRWIIQSYDKPWGFINVAGIRSPGLTSAPQIAEYVAQELISENLKVNLKEKENWLPYRKSIKRLKDLPPKEQAELIKKDPRYGNIICMCKEVSAGEVIEAIKRMKKIGIKTITLDGIKFRTMAMFGSCQGSFCRIRIAQLLAKELNINPWEIPIKERSTSYGIGDVKVFFQKQIAKGM